MGLTASNYIIFAIIITPNKKLILRRIEKVSSINIQGDIIFNKSGYLVQIQHFYIQITKVLLEPREPMMNSAMTQSIIGSLEWWTISFLRRFKGNNDSL